LELGQVVGVGLAHDGGLPGNTHPESEMKQKKAQWPWHLLTVVVLVGLAL